MNKFIKTVRESDVCYEFLRGLNGLMGLTNRELEVFSALVSLRMIDIKEKNLKLPVDRTDNRKILMSTLNIGKDNISKYVKTFIEKGLLIRAKNGKISILESLIPDIIGGRVIQTSIIIKIQENAK
jgi:hypothetical protein